jgi:hypothetical protein
MKFQKPYFLKAYTGCSEPKCIHMWAALLVGRAHTRDQLLTGHIPVNRLTSVDDCCLISWC